MFIFEILKNNGMDINDSTVPSLVILCLSFLILTIFSVLCFFNVILYFTILLNRDNKIIINVIKKHWILEKLFNVYLNTSKYFIIFEICLFI
jgi:ABC-type multidrug transport system permease subunit